jgi:RNA polymerase sigma-70 factor (ECF subfamily)
VELAKAFLAQPGATGDAAALEPVLARLVEDARGAVELDPDRFAAHVGRHWGAEPADRWPSAHARDLWLACACAAGSDAAVREFESRFRAVVEQVVGRMRFPYDRASEVKQLLLQRLLVPDEGKEPRIAGYSGRGELAGWVRAAATRVALNLIRDDPEPKADRSGDELLARLPAAAEDPELRLLKTRYAAPFKEAFVAALESLEAKQRLLLKQHYLDGLSTAELGALHRVHRVTVLRWIGETREQVASVIEKHLGTSLGLPKQELESLFRAVRSGIEMSLHDFLA